MALFNKILIANRGEIACRIMRTCKRLGITSVAVYSDADRYALHVQMADESIGIGGSTSAESYLKIDTIIDACKQSGAEAVHPGFGFLSENSDFAAALEAAGITFIGPGTHAIQVMGDKIESKKLAASSGVNTVPGYADAIDSADEAHKIAADIGCPVMLKASAGGGGKGMRVAWTQDEVKDGFTSAQNEARSAFGDDRVFVEKFIERPRHIEIQVLADNDGNCIALGERECSIQRRHQKVIEEAPSPFLDEATRKAMGEQAVALAKAVDYRSAGTVEFIVDKDRNFYFLEMNTRLQVEHPVTELITGLDLVEQMIRVAADHPLPLKQQDVKLSGWAIEARVYAEDPERNFMPSTGRLTRYQPPVEGVMTTEHGDGRVRVDTGVFEGGEISMFYDPMIAKLVTHGDTRDAAIAAMSRALDQYVIRGVSHNMAFLNALVTHPAFIKGDLTTGFIDEHFAEGTGSTSTSGNEQSGAEQSAGQNVAIAAFAQLLDHQRATQIDNQLRRTHTQKDSTSFVALVKGLTDPIEVELLDTDSAAAGNLNASRSMSMRINGNSMQLSSDWTPGTLLFEGNLVDDSGSESHIVAQTDRDATSWVVTSAGSTQAIQIMRPEVAELAQLMPEKVPPDLSRFLLSPMPGLLVKISVKEGETIKAGQELVVVEAMKMENALMAEQDGVVKSINHEEGASLSVDEVIIEFE